MIHTLLNLTRPLFVLDTETTGVDVQRDRICELGFEMWDATSLVKEWRSLIRPGVPMPPGAEAVHHITDAMLNGCTRCGRPEADHALEDAVDEHGQRCEGWKAWPTFKQLALSLASGFHDCDFAGKNVRFDLRILANEMSRAGQAWSYAGARIIDAERLEHLAVPRDLGSLHEKYTGMKHDGAHGALSDVRASTTVIVKQLETHALLPRDVQALHDLSWPGWLVADGSFRLVNGVACCMFGKHRDKPLKDIPDDYWNWLLSQNFPDDVRQLAKDAKLGKYPVATTEEAARADRHIV